MSFSSNTNNSSNFGSFILTSIDNRIEELSNEYSNSSEYLEFYYLYNDILKQLEKVLPPESSDLIHQLDSIQGNYLVGYQKYFYKQGLLDCKMMFNLLNK
ncbi:hypothetical protein EHE19_002835 [Ruminiclostridium herbifermentans]|uniref:Uncharacterized protein n=1 Tax=Ruminiclostridium herbifermentans TaxID=2488810 RepID=A0A4U7JFD0_9FIRM|nr:hypothetical protein [Ruminiclostridium herbifermentans]QNU67478.1 hypothetical protein EHE19_002835 [Ruminiclostridium herbifermentans]